MVNALDRYRLGTLAIAVTQPVNRHHGQSVVAAIASAVHLKEDTLYDYIVVARMWSENEFEALVAKTGPFGFRLSFSHFVAAARWSSKRGAASRFQAKRVLQNAVEARLSVRELKKTLDTTK